MFPFSFCLSHSLSFRLPILGELLCFVSFCCCSWNFCLQNTHSSPTHTHNVLHVTSDTATNDYNATSKRSVCFISCQNNYILAFFPSLSALSLSFSLSGSDSVCVCSFVLSHHLTVKKLKLFVQVIDVLCFGCAAEKMGGNARERNESEEKRRRRRREARRMSVKGQGRTIKTTATGTTMWIK